MENVVLTVHLILAVLLIGVVLLQRSEGGGLGIGGSPSGMMSARGAADFLTRATRWLAIVFVILSIILAAIAAGAGTGASVESTLDRAAPLPAAPDAAAPAAPAPSAPATTDDPLAGVAG